MSMTINGSGTITGLAAGGLPDATITQAELASDVTSTLTPSGAVAFFAMNTAPTGWLKANGAAISRTTYATLFAAIGTTFGTGDGSTTFNVPDMRGYFPRGWVDNGSIDSGRAFGSTQTDELKAHTHTLTIYDSTLSGGNNGKPPSGGNNFITAASTSSIGGSETRPYNVALLACIKY